MVIAHLQQYRGVTILPDTFELVLFVTIRQPLPSTLFPYTTLFRSFRIVGNRNPPTDRRSQTADRQILKPAGDKSLDFITADRKSTRLNSSHITISYAVFCSKKKEMTMKFDKQT